MFIDAASDEVNLEMKRNDNSYIIFSKLINLEIKKLIFLSPGVSVRSMGLVNSPQFITSRSQLIF